MNDTEPVVGKTAGFRAVGGCVIYVGGTRPPSNEDWDAYLDFLAPRLSPTHVTPRVVWDDSEGPSPLSRKKLVDLTRDFPVKVALVSSRRTVSVVLNWQRDAPAYHDFSPDQLDEAVAFVGVRGDAAISVVTALHGLRRLLLGSGAHP